jgi:MarR family 2-MHQ and catechol resistance regulon transcriptional repressor
MARHAHRSIAAHDLGFSDFTILEALLHKGPMLVNEIGRRIELTSGSITTAVDRLEARGLVERSRRCRRSPCQAGVPDAQRPRAHHAHL